jgi:hypothetical protein
MYMKMPSKNILICVSVILTLTAFVLSLFIFRDNDANGSTFSYIGEANRVWFFFYSLIFISAFSLNIIIFTTTGSIKNRKIPVAIYILLGFANILSLLQSIIIDFAFHEAHILLSATFTGFGCLALIIAIIAKLAFTKSKHGYYYLAMLFLTGGMNFYAIRAYGWLIATYQWMFAITALATSLALAMISSKNND